MYEALTPIFFLAQCRRLVTRIKELDISGLTDELVRKFYSGRRWVSTIDQSYQQRHHISKHKLNILFDYSLKTLTSVKGTWDSIPYRSTMAFTMTRIVGMILLLRKLQSALHETYG